MKKSILAVVMFCLFGLGLSACDTEGCTYEPEAYDVNTWTWGCNLLEIYPDELYYDRDEWEHESDYDGDGYGDHITIYVLNDTIYGKLRAFNGGLSYDPCPGAGGYGETEEIWFYVEDACDQQSREAMILIEVNCQ